MLYFDHCYTRDPNHRFFKRLGKLGFRLDKAETQHPGKAFCRFIFFAATAKRKFHYLEFIHIGKGGTSMPHPGMLLGYKKNLEIFFRKLKKSFEVRFEHKNYNWKENDQDRLPGWNFVHFKNLKFRGLKLYLVEYEKSEKRKRLKPVRKHPNGVTHVEALVFELNRNGESFFRKLISGRNWDPGTRLIFKPGRSNRLRQVVLRCEDLKRLKRKYSLDGETEFEGEPAALIRNPEKMWDIVIV